MKKTIRNLACVSLAVLMLAGCGKVPKLKDGSELVIELNGLKMTTEEFYQELKDNYSNYYRGGTAACHIFNNQILF